MQSPKLLQDRYSRHCNRKDRFRLKGEGVILVCLFEMILERFGISFALCFMMVPKS